MKNILSFFLISFLSTTTLFSQTSDNRWAVGLYGNVTSYQGDLGNYALDIGKVKLGYGITGSYYLSRTFDLRARISYSKFEIFDETGTYAAGANGYADLVGTDLGNWGFDGNMWANTLNLIFKFYRNEDVKLKPYLNLGIGETRFTTNSTRDAKFPTKKYHNLNLYYALGFRLALSEKLNLEIEAGQHYNRNDDFDGITETSAPGWVNNEGKAPQTSGRSGRNIGSVKGNDDLYQLSVGLTYNFGIPKDADNDGVSDKKDKCPATPQAIEVDNKGCPLDRDKDKVPDYKDECPDVKGVIKGCPDKDGDKIADKYDKCPTVKGPISNNGCPYSDTDKDGVPDINDKCPKVKGPKTNRGCPTTKKPTTKKPTTKKPTIKTQTNVIYFSYGKAIIKRQYYPVIDNIVNLMKRENRYYLSIKGHTDNISSSQHNLKLSQKRAMAVRNYVIRKGISANRITTTYYGENKPVNNNNTRAERMKNRRTELLLIAK